MIPVNFKPQLYRFDSVSSTNDKLRELALKGAPEGTLVFAKKQTHGRGRLGRQWHSPMGGFYLSVLLYPLTPKRITDLPFLAGVAIVQTLSQILPKVFDVSLKWPNDILVNRKKISGILSEAFGENEFYGGIIGIGINVNTPLKELEDFQEKPFQATSISALMDGEQLDMDDVLNIFQAKLFNLYRFYQEKGFAPIHALWEKNCAMVGKKVEIRGVEPHKTNLTGTLWGISERGGLMIDTGAAERVEILSGDLTCCWF
jgi:BirA family biotin operon repressor/biotin-[acetyl-CoA-carboxylase] ligase